VHSPLPFIPEQLANENKERSESAPRTANIHYAPVRFMDIEKSAGCFLEIPRSACAMYFSAAAEMNAFFRRTQKQLNGWLFTADAFIYSNATAAKR
jgi:hypothetical protein